MPTPKHFLDIDQFDQKTLRTILDCGHELKEARTHADAPKPLSGKNACHDFRETINTHTRVIPSGHAGIGRPYRAVE